MEGAVVPHNHGALIVIHGHDLGVRAAHAHRVADLHGNVGLDVALARAGDARGGQKRVAHDEPGLQPLVSIVLRAVVVVAERVQLVGRNHPALRRGHAACPIELFLGGLFGDRIGGRVAADGEELPDLLKDLLDLRVGHLS